MLNREKKRMALKELRARNQINNISVIVTIQMFYNKTVGRAGRTRSTKDLIYASGGHFKQ